MSKKYVTIDYEYLHQTDDAVLILCSEGKVWIPKNVIENGHLLDFSEDYALDFEMEIEEWFALWRMKRRIKKDLV